MYELFHREVLSTALSAQYGRDIEDVEWWAVKVSSTAGAHHPSPITAGQWCWIPMVCVLSHHHRRWWPCSMPLTPYKLKTNEFTVRSQVAAGIRRPLSSKLPRKIQDLISNCWAHNAEDRPSMRQVLQQLQTLQQCDLFHKQPHMNVAKVAVQERDEGMSKCCVVMWLCPAQRDLTTCLFIWCFLLACL